MRVIEQIDNLNIGHGTHEGMVGKQNEDSYGFFAWKLADGRDLTVGVVADGIGGQTAGELASSVAVETVKSYFDELDDDNMRSISGHLERAILAANAAVYKTAQNNPQYKGMGTTMVLVAILENKLYTAYVGDSRIYMLRDGNLQQLTIDHTWAQEAIEAGLLTREQAKKHPNRNVIKRYLGGRGQAEVDHRLMLSPDDAADSLRENQGAVLRPGDLILLCSDGLTDMIPDSEVHASLTSHEQLQPAVNELIDKANEAGGKDNITVVAMQTFAKPVAGGFMGLGVPLLLAGGVIGAFLLVLVIGAFFVFNLNRDGNDGATPTRQSAEDPLVTPTAIPAAGNPATAAVLLTRIEAGGNEAGVQDLMSTPGLIPTLRAVLTASATAVSGGGSGGATLLPTPTIDNTPTATTTTGGGGGGGSSSTNTPPPSQATNTPPPPPATNTPAATRQPPATILPYSRTGFFVPNNPDDGAALSDGVAGWRSSFWLLPGLLSLLMIAAWFVQHSASAVETDWPRRRPVAFGRGLAQALASSFTLMWLFLQTLFPK